MMVHWTNSLLIGGWVVLLANTASLLSLRTRTDRIGASLELVLLEVVLIE